MEKNQVFFCRQSQENVAWIFGQNQHKQKIKKLPTLLMTARSSAAVRAALICRIRSRNLIGVGIFTLTGKNKFIKTYVQFSRLCCKKETLNVKKSKIFTRVLKNKFLYRTGSKNKTNKKLAVQSYLIPKNYELFKCNFFFFSRINLFQAKFY